MIEGRSGGSGRGTRRELWAPPDSGSAQPADRTLYRVPTLDPRRPLISFPPPLPPRRTCLLATGKNSAAPKRTFSSALVSTGWRAQRENDRRKEGGSWRGARRELWAPPDSGSAQATDRRFVSCTDSRPEPFTAPPSHFLPPPLPHPSHLPAGPREKFCRTQAHVRLCTRLRRMAGPKGK